MRISLLPFILLSSLLLAGCDREDETIRVERVPKETARVIPAPIASSATGEIHWSAPPGWVQLPGEGMRFASFQISSQNPAVQLSITPLGLEGGEVLPNLVRWEGQIGLPPTQEADLAKVVKRTNIGGLPADLVDLAGPAEAKPPMRLLGAIIPFGKRVWFIKLSGPAELVGSQKSNFDSFVNSIRFDQPIPESAKPSAAIAEEPPLKYVAPAAWTKDGPLPLRLVSWHIGAAAQQVDVIVSALPSDSAGTHIDNINRWRGQVGLAPIKEGDPQVSKPIIVGGAEGALFDLSGADRRLLVAWVPRGSQWWFFKCVGPAAGVNDQQVAFDAFLKSIEFVDKKPT